MTATTERMPRNRTHGKFLPWLAAMLVWLGLAACEGPVGPEGPQGEPGEPGPGTRLTFSGTFDTDSTGVADLPAEAGTLDDLPIVSCYESPDGETWLVVADGYSEEVTYCEVSEEDGTLSVVLRQGIPGWHWRVVVVY